MDQSVQSDAARRSISRFTATSWVVGAVVMALIAFATFARMGINDNGALFEVGGGGGYGDYPWQNDDVAVAEESGDGVYAGDGDAVIRFPTDSTDLLQATPATDAGMTIRMTMSGDIDPTIAADDREWPEAVGRPLPDLPAVIFPFVGTTELWVEADGPWSLEIEPLEAEEITDITSGSGNALLVYRGDSVSAMFTFKGEGIFFVTAYSRETGEESLIIESDPLQERHTWEGSDVVVFSIESDVDRGAWSVDIDQYAEDSPSTPPTTPPGSEPPTEQETP